MTDVTWPSVDWNPSSTIINHVTSALSNKYTGINMSDHDVMWFTIRLNHTQKSSRPIFFITCKHTKMAYFRGVLKVPIARNTILVDLLTLPILQSWNVTELQFLTFKSTIHLCTTCQQCILETIISVIHLSAICSEAKSEMHLIRKWWKFL